MEIELPAHPPFSLRSVIESHGWVQLLPFSSDEDRRGLHYVTRLAGGSVVALHIRESPPGVTVRTRQLSQAQAAEVKDQVRWMLNLEGDFSDFYRLAGGEPRLQHVIEQARGRILRSPTLFEDTLKTILTTNTSWAGTKRMNGNLIEQFGDPLPENPARKAFPTPARLAASDVDALRQACGLGYRAPYVLELARGVAAGELDLEALKDSPLPTFELQKRLLAIKGIGRYAAANLLLILGRTDFIPIDSYALSNVSKEWHAGQSIGAPEVEAAFERWGAWQGMVYWFWEWTHDA